MRTVRILVVVVGLMIIFGSFICAGIVAAIGDNDNHCRTATDLHKKADLAEQRYEAAKGTPDEFRLAAEAKRAMVDAVASDEKCHEAQNLYFVFRSFFELIGMGVAFCLVIFRLYLIVTTWQTRLR